MAGASATVTYRPDPAAIRELGFMAGMRSFTTDVATKYTRVVVSFTPKRTGRAQKAIRVGESGADRTSAYTTVKGSRSFWHFIEFGTATNPPYAPFRKAAAQMGLRFEDPGKGGG
jgi:hypothetical protein